MLDILISEQLAAGTQGHSRSVGYLQKHETTLDETDPVPSTVTHDLKFTFGEQ